MAQYINKDNNPLSGLSHEEIDAKFRRDYEEQVRREHHRALLEVDRNIKQLQDTIKKLEGQRGQPPGIMGNLQNALDANIRKKVELTNGAQLQDAVAPTREEDVEAYKKGEMDVEELNEREQKRKSGTLKRPAFHQTYKYEELFQENIDGDLILTFPDEVTERMGWKVGDTLGISVSDNGGLVIKLLS